jgi:hypothetical protein
MKLTEPTRYYLSLVLTVLTDASLTGIVLWVASC